MIPTDPYILLSYVNTKLRDDYPSLQALCRGLDIDETQLRATLQKIGYQYTPDTNQFK